MNTWKDKNVDEVWAYIEQKNNKKDDNLKKAMNYYER